MIKRCLAVFCVFMIVLFAVQAFAAPMTLSSCIDYGLQHSRELNLKQIAVKNQELATLMKRAEFSFNISSDFSQDDESDISKSVSLKKKVIGGIDLSSAYRAKDYDADADNDSESVSVRISKVILGGGSIDESRLSIDNSLIDEVVRLNELSKYRRELKFKIKKSYYSLIRNNQSLKVWDMRLARSRTNLVHALEREDPLDIATARIDVPENEAAVLSAKRQIESSLDALKVLIGMDVTDTIAVDQSFEYKVMPKNIKNDIAFCLGNHEDILNARFGRKKLENNRRVERWRILPKVSIWGDATRSLADSESGLDNDDDFSAGVSLSWEFLSPTSRAKLETLRNDLLASDLGISATEQAKLKEIRDLARRLEEAELLVGIQQQKLKISERRVELYSDRWKNGEIDILEYIRSQNDYENTKINLINQKTTYMELEGAYTLSIGK